MVEKIYAYLCLVRAGFIDDASYNEVLDEFFMQDPDNELLLELEFLSNDIAKSWTFFHQYCVGEQHISYDFLKVGKVVFSHLEIILKSNKMEKSEFIKRGYKLWTFLPTHMYETDMFWILNVADDCLSIGDEEGAIDFYKKAFAYYKRFS